MNLAIKSPQLSTRQSDNELNYSTVFHKTSVNIQKAVRALEVITTNNYHTELISTFPQELNIVE